MSKRTAELSVLTANRLGDGRAVFLNFEGDWVESIDAAVAAKSADEVRWLESRGAFDAAQNIVVEPYLVEVREVGGRFSPIRQRERVRVAGPSILDDVPGYVSGRAVVRQAHHGDADRGPDREPRAEHVETRTAGFTPAEAA